MKKQINPKMLSNRSINLFKLIKSKKTSVFFLILFSLNGSTFFGQVGTLLGWGLTGVCQQYPLTICPGDFISPNDYANEAATCYSNNINPTVGFKKNNSYSGYRVTRANWSFSASSSGQVSGFDASGLPVSFPFNALDVLTPSSYSSPGVTGFVQFAINNIPTNVPFNQISFSITINPVTFAGATYVYCPNTTTSVAIGVTPPAQGGPWTYNWLPTGGNNIPATVSPTANTIYTLTATTATGNCTSTTTVAVTISCTPTGCCIGNNCADIIKNPLTSNWEVPLSNFNYVFNRGLSNTGKVGIGFVNCTPGNLLEVNKGTVNNISGLRLTDLATSSPLVANNKVLSINGSGDVILVSANASGITNSCATLNFIPKTLTAGGNLGCSQIFDDGTSVGIGTTTGFAYTWAGGLTGGTLPAASGIVKLNINGVSKALAYFATSDQKFKKDIIKIDNALDIIKKIEGKTYYWKSEEFKDKGFSTSKQYGFIAQELEKIVPEAVAIDENGDRSVNYDMIIPILVQSTKEQSLVIDNLQKQIDELKSMLQANLSNIVTTNIPSQAIDLSDKNAIVLNQNVPNPFAETTTISYVIPEKFNKAQIQFFTSDGKLIKTTDITTTGKGVLNVFANDLSSGIYSYSLIIDGKLIETKRMVKQ